MFVRSKLVRLSVLAASLLLSTLPSAACVEPQNYLRHFVALEFKEGTTAEQIAEIDKTAFALKGKIKEIVSVEGGANLSPDFLKSKKGFADGFTFTFKSAADRDAYLVHPEHKALLGLAMPHLVKKFAFDYMVPALDARLPNKKVVDLSHVLGPDLPDFHKGKTAFKYTKLYTIAKNGYGDGAFTTPEHYGTHVDAPVHFIAGAKSIDKVEAASLVAPAVVIDVRQECSKDADYRLTVDKIKEFEKGGEIAPGTAVLLLTGWAERFADADKYRNADKKGGMHYPAFSTEAAEYLLSKGVKTLGLDTISADYGPSTDFPVHKKILGAGGILIENLNNLDKLPARGAKVYFGALPIKDGTGSPARVIAVIE